MVEEGATKVEPCAPLAKASLPRVGIRAHHKACARGTDNEAMGSMPWLERLDKGKHGSTMSLALSRSSAHLSGG